MDTLKLIGCGLAAALILSPVYASEILFDNGEAIDNAGLAGGRGYDNNEIDGWQVFDDFSLAEDGSIESVWFQMAGGTEPFIFSVHADNQGVPGTVIYSVTLEVGDYRFDNARTYEHLGAPQDPGYDFTFELDHPLTLVAGDYWISFWGIGTSQFFTLGTGPGDGFYQKRISTGQLLSRTGNTPFRLMGGPIPSASLVIDIKPDGDTNPVNPRSNGVIPVAVLGSIDFDATQLDAATVSFGPGEAAPAHGGHVEDVDGDGFMDMLFHFRTRESGIVCGDTEAFLTAETFDRQSLAGSDTLTTVGCNNSAQAEGGNASQEAEARTEVAATSPAMSLVLALLGLLGFARRRLPG